MDTKNKIALVTGANKGIGFEIAQKLGAAGCTVIVGARSEKLGEEACAKLKASGVEAIYLNLDLLKPETIEKAATAVEEKYGRLDILVNNAGIVERGDGSPINTSVDAVETTLRTNFIGPLRVTQAMAPLLKKSAEGSVVNVSSALGSCEFNGDRNSPYADAKFLGYSASKAALNMMTVQLAYELRDTNIKVNSVCPGYCATDINDNKGLLSAEEGAREPARLALLDKTGPTGEYRNTEGTIPW
ncbi:MAG: SDR family oxidoreductase [Leptolyngbya sp.]|nr:SDR family oxidoreductase [Candidatus Melainabacteria bacterium]